MIARCFACVVAVDDADTGATPGDRVTLRMYWKGTAWKASLPAVLGKTRRTE
jgi:hypothetical protein